MGRHLTAGLLFFTLWANAQVVPEVRIIKSQCLASMSDLNDQYSKLLSQYPSQISRLQDLVITLAIFEVTAKSTQTLGQNRKVESFISKFVSRFFSDEEASEAKTSLRSYVYRLQDHSRQIYYALWKNETLSKEIDLMRASLGSDLVTEINKSSLMTVGGQSFESLKIACKLPKLGCVKREKLKELENLSIEIGMRAALVSDGKIFRELCALTDELKAQISECPVELGKEKKRDTYEGPSEAVSFFHDLDHLSQTVIKKTFELALPERKRLDRINQKAFQNRFEQFKKLQSQLSAF